MRAPLAAGTRPPELSPEAAISEISPIPPTPTRLLVAISGGSDSTGLLITLAKALGSHPVPHTLFAATVDHGLRPASAGEALQASALCEGIGISHQILRWSAAKPATVFQKPPASLAIACSRRQLHPWRRMPSSPATPSTTRSRL